MSRLFICYPKCTTCQKAKKWLDERQIEYTFRDIKQDNPTYDELSAWLVKSGLPEKSCRDPFALLPAYTVSSISLPSGSANLLS
jgi:arsenate reductase